MSRVTANIPAGTQEYLSVTSQQLFNRQKLRGVSIVFGIGEERPFYLEKVPTLLVARLKHNFQFFFLNYLVLTGVLFFLTMLTSPTTLIGLGLLAALWMYVIRQTQSGFMVISGMYSVWAEKCLVWSYLIVGSPFADPGQFILVIKASLFRKRMRPWDWACSVQWLCSGC